MDGALLQVKVRVPPLGVGVVARDAVRARVEHGLVGAEGFRRPVTLVSAPAGHGKTTFVRWWLAGRAERTAWLSLDAADSDEERFWSYLVAATQTIAPGVGDATAAMLRDGAARSGAGTETSYLTPLLNDLVGLESPMFLVIDDYHVIDAPRVDRGMCHLLTHLPPTVHVVVTTRSDPPWPLAAWRGRGTMAEVRMRDLRFEPAEAAGLLASVGGPALSGRQVEELCDRTEGWATGLRLAALSLLTAPDPEAFVAAFTGGHQHVLHYLSDEVLDGLPAVLRDFLLTTSVCERLCGDLCDVLTGRSDGAETLAELERRNLFVVRLDDTGTWYRYHQLFADLLRLRLQRTRPGGTAELHRRACAWFLSTGEPGEAVRHAHAAGSESDVVRVLRAHATDILRTHGSLHLHRSLSGLSGDVLAGEPRLLAYRALLTMVFDGRESARNPLAEAVRLAEATSDDHEFIGMVATAQAFACVTDGALGEALGHAERALALLGDTHPYWRMNVAVHLGDAYLFAGNPHDALARYEQAHRSAQATGHAVYAITTSFKVATSLHHMGRLDEAEAWTRDALLEAKRESCARAPRTGLLWGLLGELLRERGDLDEARSCIERALHLSRPERTAYAWNCLHAAALAYSTRRFVDVLTIVGTIEALDRASALPTYVTVPARAWAALAQIAMGATAAADRRLTNATTRERDGTGTTVAALADAEDTVEPGHERRFLAPARARLAAGTTPDATVLDEIATRAAASNHVVLQLEVTLVRALAAQAGGDDVAAEHLVHEALGIAASHGFHQSVLDDAAPFANVAARVACSAGAGAAVRALAERVCAVAEPGTARAAASTARTLPDDRRGRASTYEFAEPLSPREVDVLRHVARGLSNEATGAALAISAGTVKWHLANVYGKLGVPNRTRAVTAARDLGYL